MRRFSEHGSLDLHVQDSILLVEGCGPWNLEAVKEAYIRFVPLIETLYGGPWGALVVLLGDPIYVPDAANYIIKRIKNERMNGCVASAIMVGESNSPEFAKRHLSEIHTKAGDTFRFFSEKEEAVWWLVQKIISGQVYKP
jgi:predicted nicotinamide N-methyase